MLKLLGRRHTAKQAEQAVHAAIDAGIDNISIDLMYGLPALNIKVWEQTLREALALPVTHVSAYCLSVESGTTMEIKLNKGELTLPADDVSEQQYRMLVDATLNAGFEHYEISNFARAGKHSLHNSSYWKGTPYIGLGAGAHSFDGSKRRANTSDVLAYIKSGGEAHPEIELLTDLDRINESIFLALRTKEGLDTISFKEQYGEKALQEVLQMAEPHKQSGRLQLKHKWLSLTEKGIFVSNDIISDLLFVD